MADMVATHDRRQPSIAGATAASRPLIAIARLVAVAAIVLGAIAALGGKLFY